MFKLKQSVKKTIKFQPVSIIKNKSRLFVFPNKNLLTFCGIASILFLLLLTLSSCSDSPTSTGSDLLKDDFINVNEINSLKDSLQQSSEYFKKVISLSSSEELLIGKSYNVEAYSLLNFFVSMDDTILQDVRAGNINIISAEVTLKKLYKFDTIDSVFDFTVHRINSSWVSTGYSADSIAFLNYDQNDISSNRDYTNDSVTTFNLDNSVVLDWMKHGQDTSDVSYSDHGILLKPTDNSTRVNGYQAISAISDNADWPHLIVIYQKNGYDPDTLSFIPEGDVSVVFGDKPAELSNDNIIVQSGVVFNSKLWFDISSIPVNSVINYAELVLTIDTLQTHTGSGYTNSLTAYRILDASNYDSLSSGSTLTGSDSQFTGNVTSLIQDIYSAQINNGILLTTGSQLQGVELFALKGSNAEEALRPQLKIIYTRKQ